MCVYIYVGICMDICTYRYICVCGHNTFGLLGLYVGPRVLMIENGIISAANITLIQSSLEASLLSRFTTH
jgi:hypothetical protein